jgi:nitrate/nitrite transporter NarK
MNITSQFSIPMSEAIGQRHGVAAQPRGLPIVRTFIAAVAWTLAGAGIALALIVAAAFAMLCLTDMDGSSSTSVDSPAGLVAEALPQDANVHRLWEIG